MGVLIVVCPRPGRPAIVAERLRSAALRLAPPEMPIREPMLLETAGVVAAVANPTDEGVWLHDNEDQPGGDTPGGGAAVGGLFGDNGSWWHAKSAAPEGTYALARWDAHVVELVADICGSRTIWYALTQDVFLASTSQRALVMLLGSFELLPEATACFLSSGTLGPTVSWDARIRRVPPDARAVLDRASWRVTVHETAPEFGSATGDNEVEVGHLREAIATTCGDLNLDLERWVLPLSGGHDSRTILAFLVQNGSRPRCVTWTTRASLRNPLSDASIARVVARHYHVEHELLYLDASRNGLETTLQRFVAANEGRNDEIAGYLDGFALWRDLALAGVQGIIRGDEPFGLHRRRMGVDDGRRHVGGATPDDYPEGHPLHSLELARPSWPARLQKSPQEQLSDYCHRLSQQGFLPTVLAGLAGPKALYLETVNPLASRLIVRTARLLPPKLRDHARAYQRIVDGLNPFVPYARFASTLPVPDLLVQPDLLELCVRELVSPAMQRILAGDRPLHVLTAMSSATGERRDVRTILKALTREASGALPTRLAVELAPPWRGPESLPAAKLAFRALLASRTVSLFEEDAWALAGSAR